MDPLERVVHSYPRRSLSWRVATLGLMLYSIALAAFAILPLLPPPNPLLAVEVFIAAVALSAAVGLGLRLFLPAGRRERWGHYAYLYTAVAGFATFAAFNLAADEADISIRTVMGLFIGAGMVTSLGAHLEYGGKESIEDLLNPGGRGRG